jgi:hypothetical protein
MTKDFLKRLDQLEETIVKTRRRREFDFGTMSAAQLWTLSIRVGEALGRRRYYWEVQSLGTGTPPPFVDLPVRLEGLGKDELSDICTAVRDEMQRRFDGDAFSIEAQLHRAALDELNAR